MVHGEDFDLDAAEGKARAYVATPDGEGPWPGALLYMDGIGFRDAIRRLADQVAARGYVVLAPDVFYRSAPYALVDAAKAFAGPGPELDRVMALLGAASDQAVMNDAALWLDWLAARADVRGAKQAVFGYCLGGGLALSTACRYPERVACAASFHGGRFVVDPGAPPIVAARVRCPVYIGVAETDSRHTPEVSARLDAALTKAGVTHAIETYAGAAHGWVMADTPVYDAAAADKHMERLLAFLDASFAELKA